jgi:hypothetical protein
MMIRYAVNRLIIKNEAYNPISLVLLKTSNREINISTAGRAQAIDLAYEVIKGDLLN